MNCRRRYEFKSSVAVPFLGNGPNDGTSNKGGENSFPTVTVHGALTDRTVIALAANAQAGGSQVPVRAADLRVDRVVRASKGIADTLQCEVEDEEAEVTGSRASHPTTPRVAIQNPKPNSILLSSTQVGEDVLHGPARPRHPAQALGPTDSGGLATGGSPRMDSGRPDALQSRDREHGASRLSNALNSNLQTPPSCIRVSARMSIGDARFFGQPRRRHKPCAENGLGR